MDRADHEADDLGELRDRVRETERLQRQLIDAEQRAADVPQLEYRIGELEVALAAARHEAESARSQLAVLDQRLLESERVLVDVMNSPSWQLTEPLRRAKKLLR